MYSKISRFNRLRDAINQEAVRRAYRQPCFCSLQTSNNRSFFSEVANVAPPAPPTPTAAFCSPLSTHGQFTCHWPRHTKMGHTTYKVPSTGMRWNREPSLSHNAFVGVKGYSMMPSFANEPRTYQTERTVAYKWTCKWRTHLTAPKRLESSNMQSVALLVLALCGVSLATEVKFKACSKCCLSLCTS